MKLSMKMLFVLFAFIFCFSQCTKSKYTVLFNQYKKKYRFSQNDTLLYKGGILSLKDGAFFIGYDKSKGNKYVSLGSTNDSFLYIINSLTYYSAKSTVNMGIETHTYPEKKREYLKLNDKTYKILSVDSSKITLEKIKQSTEIHTAFEPLIWLPNLAFNSIKNEPYNLEDFRGKDKFVLISVWASWCSPCIESMPFLDNIERRFKDKLQIISLNCKDDNPDFVKYTTNANILYGKITENDYKRLNGFGFPFYILFNSKGELISYHDTIKNYNWITSKIK